MHFFDRIEQREVNGFQELFAIDDIEGKEQLLRNITIDTEQSAITGNWLSINSLKKRTSFKLSTSMNTFAEDILKLANKLDRENANKKYSLK